MKKRIFLICALLCCACTPLSETDVNKRIVTVLKRTAKTDQIAVANRSKPYFSYYLPSDMGVKKANATSAVLNKDGYDIIFNFSTSNLVIHEFYTDLSDDNQEDIMIKQYSEESLKSLDEQQLLIEKQKDEKDKANQQSVKISYAINKEEKQGIVTYRSHYNAVNDKGLMYLLKIKRVNDDYYIHLDGTIASFTAAVPAEEVDKVINSMMIILKSIRYDKEKVLKDFSLQYDLKAMEEKFKENKDFIYQNLPSEGYLEDLINND